MRRCGRLQKLYVVRKHGCVCRNIFQCLGICQHRTSIYSKVCPTETMYMLSLLGTFAYGAPYCSVFFRTLVAWKARYVRVPPPCMGNIVAPAILICSVFSRTLPIASYQYVRVPPPCSGCEYCSLFPFPTLLFLFWGCGEPHHIRHCSVFS